MKASEMPGFTVRVNPTIKDKLKEIAAKNNRKVSDEIRMILERHVAENRRLDQRKEAA